MAGVREGGSAVGRGGRGGCRGGDGDGGGGGARCVVGGGDDQEGGWGGRDGEGRKRGSKHGEREKERPALVLGQRVGYGGVVRGVDDICAGVAEWVRESGDGQLDVFVSLDHDVLVGGGGGFYGWGGGSRVGGCEGWWVLIRDGGC